MTPEQERPLIDRILAHVAAGTREGIPDAVLLHRLPLVLGSAAALPGPDTFLAVDAFDLPVLLTRDGDCRVHLFLNGCTHRGAKLVDDGHGFRRTFACPYHGWCFSTDGRLVHISDPAGFAGLDPEAFGLMRLPVAEAHGLLWGVLTPSAPLDLATFLGDWSPGLAGLDAAAYRAALRRALGARTPVVP